MLHGSKLPVTDRIPRWCTHILYHLECFTVTNTDSNGVLQKCKNGMLQKSPDFVDAINKIAIELSAHGTKLIILPVTLIRSFVNNHKRRYLNTCLNTPTDCKNT